MNATSQYFELAQPEAQVMNVAAELAALSSEDAIVTLNGGWLSLIYVSRGSEHIQLSLSEKYAVSDRLSYTKSTFYQLTNIKKDMVGE